LPGTGNPVGISAKMVVGFETTLGMVEGSDECTGDAKCESERQEGERERERERGGRTTNARVVARVIIRRDSTPTTDFGIGQRPH
jgi:hypothetical protein